MALPTNISYGTVVGRFLLGYADGSDLDVFPDGVAAQGSIFFVPSAASLKDASASPDPVTIIPARVEATLDAEGYLCGPDGNRGIRLVATDDPDANPIDWTWTVEFRMTDPDGTVVALDGFSFALPGGTEVDLTVLAPVPDANGTYYLVGPAGPPNVLTIGTVTTVAPNEPATASITGTSPSQVLNLGIPQGDLSNLVAEAPLMYNSTTSTLSLPTIDGGTP